MTHSNSQIPTNGTIIQRAAHGVGWNYISFGSGKVLVFVTTAILARLLTKEEFGIIGFATLAITYLSIVKDMGLGASLIQRRGNVDKISNTVFSLNLLTGFSLTLFIYIIAPLVSEFFREPLVLPILRWLGLTFMINAFGSIHVVLLQRNLDFRRRLIPDLGRSLFKGVFSIIFALTGAGVWALVYGQLIGALTSVVLAWAIFPWRPKLSIDWTEAAALFKYGFSVIGIDGLAIINDNLDYLLVGRIFGSAALGIYSLAYRLPELLMINFLWVIGAVVFPAYSAVQTQPKEMREIFLITFRIVEILIVPLCLGLVITADPLVRVAFGKQWLDIIPILRVLAVYAWVLSVGFHVGGIYKAIGRLDISVKLSVATLVLLIPALLVGSNFGLIGIAFGHLFVGLIRVVMRLIVTSRFLNISLNDILSQFTTPFRGGIALVTVTIPIMYLTIDFPPLLRLLLVSFSGALGYIGVLWIKDRESILRLGKMIGIPVAG